MLSVLARGDPNHSLACPLPPYDRELVHRLRDRPNPFPPRSSPLEETLAPLRDSFEEVRKRFKAPRVNISSVERLNEVGAIGDVERRKKGFSRFLDAQMELDPPFLEVVEDEPSPMGVAWSASSGRVVVDVLRDMSTREPEVLLLLLHGFLEVVGKDEDLATVIGGDKDDMHEEDDWDAGGGAMECSLAEMTSPLTPGITPIPSSG